MTTANTGNIGVLLALAGASFTLLSAVMKLRDSIDEKRDLVLGWMEKNIVLDEAARLYVLHKDIVERAVVMVVLMVNIGLISIAGSVYIILNDQITVDPFITVVVLLFGAGCTIGGMVTALSACRDYLVWRHRILHEEWKECGLRDGWEQMRTIIRRGVARMRRGLGRWAQ